ncbi:MAG TPA: hypothetical protein VLA52_05400 [Thermohalobaculum sp.]|nr:hypothetical protein [Thermohalobaculum sp.]
MALLFLVTLLAVVVILNWRTLSGAFGAAGKPCDWSRIHPRDRDGKQAWFCPACQREELVSGKGPPTLCGARAGDRERIGG